ncbi:MAG TPA: hypothetical protein VJ820_02045, partial [Propionibacteriaceae bacterium]|nr:hypothetical protein [Propionibacteriaceae bacterium]
EVPQAIRRERTMRIGRGPACAKAQILIRSEPGQLSRVRRRHVPDHCTNSRRHVTITERRREAA